MELVLSKTCYSSKEPPERRSSQGAQCETRLAGWTTIESPLHPTEHLEEMVERVVLVDCLTLWLTNYMLEYNVFSLNNNDNDDGKDNIITATERMKAADKASDAIKQEITTMIGQWNTTFVFVTNLPRIEQKNTRDEHDKRANSSRNTINRIFD